MRSRRSSPGSSGARTGTPRRGSGCCARPGRSARGWGRRSTRWAASCGTCSWAVTRRDVDLVVEGDGIAFARRLGEEIGGTVLVHGAFGTASIEGGRAPAGAGSTGRARPRRRGLDAARAVRAGRARCPTCRPPGSRRISRRRDFSVNAMAMALAPDRFGRLLDPLGGQRDVRARRLRALRPLAFVEDPTRIFRAARYAARLGLRLDRQTRAAIGLAVTRRSYVGALRPAPLARDRAGGGGAARPPGLRASREMAGRNAAERKQCLDWSSRRRRSSRALGEGGRGGGRSGGAVHAGPPRRKLRDRGRAVSRSPRLSGEPRANLEAGAMAGPVARRLAAPRLRPSAVDDVLRPVPPAAALSAWLRGSAPARRRIEWYLATGRAVQPRLSGRDLLALGDAARPAGGPGARPAEAVPARRRGGLGGRGAGTRERMAHIGKGGVR